MTAQIETGIPLPPVKWVARNRGKSKYPFKDMKINDSFEVVGRKEGISAAHLASMWGRNNRPYRFSSRKTENGYRIWRVA